MGTESYSRAEHRDSRPRPGKRRTGRPAHFKGWTRDRGIRKYLRTVHTLKLAQAEELSGAAMVKALSALAASFPNLWSLSQATRPEILSIPGVGPRTVLKLAAYLAEKNVPLQWGGGQE